MNKNVFRNMSYGMYVITTWDNGNPVGCFANSAMQITSETPTIAISINHLNYTHKCIKDTGKFAISIIAEDSDPSIIGTFGFYSSKDKDKFENVSYEVKSYLPVIKDSCGYITCDVINSMETETHTIFLGKVTDGEIIKNSSPMTYSYYHNVIKGSSPKKAPTYIEE